MTAIYARIDGTGRASFEIGGTVVAGPIGDLSALLVVLDRLRDVLCDVPDGGCVHVMAPLPEGLTVTTTIAKPDQGGVCRWPSPPRTARPSAWH